MRFFRMGYKAMVDTTIECDLQTTPSIVLKLEMLGTQSFYQNLKKTLGFYQQPYLTERCATGLRTSRD